MSAEHGGDLIARILGGRGVEFLFTLCGGHISPILVGAKQRGIRVIDVRHEATAVFAADAVARLTGRPGVAAVTAGPGATNALTAIKNTQLAQSPVVVLAGATATILKGRGALQDIDHLALTRPHVKRAFSIAHLGDVAPVLEEAFHLAQAGVPGPVFVECPADVLYPADVVRAWYESARPKSEAAPLGDRIRRGYLRRHFNRLFSHAGLEELSQAEEPVIAPVTEGDVHRAIARLSQAERPVLLMGSQAMLHPKEVAALAAAVGHLGLPVYLSGMARGLLGREHPLLLRHRRSEALREADLVLLAGVPCDFRLGYGRHISRTAVLLSVNRSRRDLVKNRRPTLAMIGDPAEFLCRLADAVGDATSGSAAWLARLRERDAGRVEEIDRLASVETEFINPLALCQAIDGALAEDSVVVLDGGDFAATASYVVHPRWPLSSLDPGPFGTLGGGAGFALGAKLCRPEAEVWIVYGDGSAAFSLAEFDTFVRHAIPVIAVVGNDAAWTQIARGQMEVFGDDVATSLRRTAYHVVVEGYGGAGLSVDRSAALGDVLKEAKKLARGGAPVLVNASVGETGFRKGSLAF
jgi:acetolactate synthase-1/2/3 large subunit